MSFGCSSKEGEKFQIEYLILKGLDLKSLNKSSTAVTEKVIHKC